MRNSEISLEMLRKLMLDDVGGWEMNGSSLRRVDFTRTEVRFISVKGLTQEGMRIFDLDDGLGRHIRFVNHTRPEVDDAEASANPEKIGVYVWFTQPNDEDSWSSPRELTKDDLRLTLIHPARVAKNDAIVKATQDKLHQERVEQGTAQAIARQAHRVQYDQEHVVPFAQALVGQIIESATFEGGHLTLVLRDGSPIRINVQLTGVHSGGVTDLADLTVDYGVHHLSSVAALYPDPQRKS